MTATEMSRDTISVVVPSYGRPDALRACVEAVAAQLPAPAEVVCVLREEDRGARHVLSELTLPIPVRVVCPRQPGLVSALQAGLENARSTLVAFVDDDAVPRAGWIERIQAHFARDARVVGVGGRDWVHYDGGIDEPRRRGLAVFRGSKHGPKVGVLEWTGRVTNGHHGGIGPARDVDVLKGANMAFRREELLVVGFDPCLRGSGSQVHNEIWPCLHLRGCGRRIIYDPAVAVDHHVRSRPVGDERAQISSDAIADATFNETRAVLSCRGLGGRIVTLTWGLLIGTSPSPGAIQIVRPALRGTPGVGARFRAAATARLDAYRSLQSDRRQANGTT